MRISSLMIALSSAIAISSAAHAQVIGFSTGGTQRTDGGRVAGNSFNAAFVSKTFNSLGFIDTGEDGLMQSYTVGLWDTATQTLLASTVVTPSSPLIDGYRYASIPSTVIPADTQFTIAALLPSGPVDPWLDETINTLYVGFTGAGQGQYDSSGILTYPTTSDDSNYAIVNASPTIVPEPAGLLTAAAILYLVRRRPRVDLRA